MDENPMTDAELAQAILELLDAHANNGGQTQVVLAKVQGRMLGFMEKKERRRAWRYMTKLVKAEVN